MHYFSRVNSFSSCLKDLRDLYYNTELKKVQQENNYFYVEKSSHLGVVKVLDEHMVKKHRVSNVSHCFVKYNQWSWSKVEEISEKELVVITAVEKSVDCNGGDIIAFDQHFNLPPLKDHLPVEGDDYHKEIVVPHTINLNSGQSVICFESLQYGVSQVESGQKVNLVSRYVKIS